MKKIVIFALLLMSFISYSYPIVKNVNNTRTIEVYHNVTITATVEDNVTGTNVYLNFIYPFNESIKMTRITNDTYELNYTPNSTGAFIFNVSAVSSSGYNSSGLYYFRSVANKSVAINVNVVASCKASIIIYCPSKQNNCYEFVKNQSVPIFGFVENSGNVPINETTRLEVRDANGTLTGWFMGGTEEGKFSDNEEHEVGLGDDQFFWGVWFTDDHPLGNYTVDIYTDVSSLFDIYNENTTVDAINTTGNNCVTNTTEVNGTNVTTLYCSYINITSCSNLDSGVATVVNTTQVSNVTIPNMKENTSAHYGTGVFNGDTYNVYSFYMSGCDGYCYACASKDSQINTSEECNYVGGLVPDINQTVHSVDSSGNNITFTGLSRVCNYIKTVYNCTVNDTGSANCTVYKYCYSFAHVQTWFEIVERIGNLKPVNETVIKPVPTPTPSPRPTPTPGINYNPGETPKIKIVITPIKPNWEGYQEEYTPIIINVTNMGNMPAENITIAPLLPDGWLYQNATISFLNVSETVNRTIFINPKYWITPGTYAVPVRAYIGNTTADVNYFWFKVLPGRNLTRITIEEFPRVIGLRSNSNTTMAILLSNTGKIPLHNITIRFENADMCLKNISYTSGSLQINETGSFAIKMETKTGPQMCNATLIVGTKEGAYAFAPITIKVSPPFAFFPVKWPLVPIIIFVLTMILFAMLRHEKKKKKEDRTFGKIFFTLLLIDVLLIVYVLLWVFGVVPLY